MLDDGVVRRQRTARHAACAPHVVGDARASRGGQVGAAVCSFKQSLNGCVVLGKPHRVWRAACKDTAAVTIARHP